MGQYYRAYLEGSESDKYEVYRPWCGAKLCEIAFYDMSFVNLVLNRLIERPMKLAFIGDYADDYSDKWGEYNHTGYIIRYNRAHKEEKGLNAIICMKEEEARSVQKEVKDTSSSYVVNKTRKEFISLKEYYEKALENYPDKPVMHPLVLLTACGNGRGGGDFYSNNREVCSAVGLWAFDIIEIVMEKERVNSTYKNVTDDYMFVEA